MSSTIDSCGTLVRKEYPLKEGLRHGTIPRGTKAFPSQKGISIKRRIKTIVSVYFI